MGLPEDKGRRRGRGGLDRDGYLALHAASGGVRRSGRQSGCAPGRPERPRCQVCARKQRGVGPSPDLSPEQLHSAGSLRVRLLKGIVGDVQHVREVGLGAPPPADHAARVEGLANDDDAVSADAGDAEVAVDRAEEGRADLVVVLAAVEAQGDVHALNAPGGAPRGRERGLGWRLGGRRALRGQLLRRRRPGRGSAPRRRLLRRKRTVAGFQRCRHSKGRMRSPATAVTPVNVATKQTHSPPRKSEYSIRHSTQAVKVLHATCSFSG